MTFHDRLLGETRSERDRFLAIPVLAHVAENGVPRHVYLAFLAQAYHHVKHTCPLLEHALARCTPDDDTYRDGLLDYIEEETGHDRWILNDIAALGGDPSAVRDGTPGVACRAMLGYAAYAIDHVSPYALLGMVHVLEGTSARIASRAAEGIARSLDMPTTEGFSYLTSHGALDQDHVRFFERLVNGIGNEKARRAIIETANVIYRLYGEIFRDLDRMEDNECRLNLRWRSSPAPVPESDARSP